MAAGAPSVTVGMPAGPRAAAAGAQASRGCGGTREPEMLVTVHAHWQAVTVTFQVNCHRDGAGVTVTSVAAN